MACCACSTAVSCEALGDDGSDGRERILDAVVQLFEDQLLQLVGRLALPGVDAGLGQQTAGIDLGLRKEKPQADILCRQKVLMWFCAAPRAMVCTEIIFGQPQLYHYELAAALIFGGL